MRWILASVVVVLLGAVGPAAADIFRWTDDAGQEHFTTDLHRVPSKYRGGAKKRQALEEVQTDTQPSTINRIQTDDVSKTKRALKPKWSRKRYRHSSSTVASNCASWQRDKARKLERKIENYERKVDLYEEKERRLVRLEDRLRAENNAERYEIYLEQAEEDYDAFLDQMRQKGVEPGCLR